MHTITTDIRFVGAEDDNLDLFEAQYPIPAGISYNSYLIADSSVAVVDAVDMRRCSDWLAAIADSCAALGRLPEYLIVQHMEPDHSGSVRAFVDRYPGATIVCTAKAAGMLANFFEDVDFSSRCRIVADGDTLCLGAHTLSFVTAPMVHWPEVMMTLDETDGVLFSADAFGSFAMSDSAEAWDAEARRYYTNIVGRFGPSVQAVMKKLAGRKFGIVAPLHGPVLSENLAHYWHLYDKWSRYEPEEKGVMIAYASMYGNTESAAQELDARLCEKGCTNVAVYDVSNTHVSYLISEAFKYSHIVLASVTYNLGIYPVMHNFLMDMKALNMQNRTFALIENGSWACKSGDLMQKFIEEELKNMTVLNDRLSIASSMGADKALELDALADAIIDSMKEE